MANETQAAASTSFVAGPTSATPSAPDGVCRNGIHNENQHGSTNSIENANERQYTDTNQGDRFTFRWAVESQPLSWLSRGDAADSLEEQSEADAAENTHSNTNNNNISSTNTDEMATPSNTFPASGYRMTQPPPLSTAATRDITPARSRPSAAADNIYPPYSASRESLTSPSPLYTPAHPHAIPSTTPLTAPGGADGRPFSAMPTMHGSNRDTEGSDHTHPTGEMAAAQGEYVGRRASVYETRIGRSRPATTLPYIRIPTAHSRWHASPADNITLEAGTGTDEDADAGDGVLPSTSPTAANHDRGASRAAYRRSTLHPASHQHEENSVSSLNAAALARCGRGGRHRYERSDFNRSRSESGGRGRVGRYTLAMCSTSSAREWSGRVRGGGRSRGEASWDGHRSGDPSKRHQVVHHTYYRPERQQQVREQLGEHMDERDAQEELVMVEEKMEEVEIDDDNRNLLNHKFFQPVYLEGETVNNEAIVSSTAAVAQVADSGRHVADADGANEEANDGAYNGHDGIDSSMRAEMAAAIESSRALTEHLDNCDINIQLTADTYAKKEYGDYLRGREEAVQKLRALNNIHGKFVQKVRNAYQHKRIIEQQIRHSQQKVKSYKPTEDI